MSFGRPHCNPYVLFLPVMAFPFSTLYASKVPSRRARPMRNVLASRRSSCVYRPSNSVPGSIRFTEAVPLHGTRVPHDPRLRPNEGVISATGTARNTLMPGEGTAPADATVQVVNQTLEGSNVNAVEEMVNMIEIGRQFDTHMNLMQTVSENNQKLAQLLQE